MKQQLPAVLLVMACVHPATADEFDQILNSFGNLSTVAGTAFVDDGGVNGWNASFEGGPATSAELSRPHMAHADLSGNIYVADKDAHAIRLITPAGTIHTIAGTNVPGFSGDGEATTRQLNEPNGLFTFPDGTTYILDLANDRIRRWDSSGNLSTIIHDPEGIAFGRGLWVSADESLIYYSSGSRIRRWTPEEGLTTYASGFQILGNLTVDPFDGLLVATDREGDEVRKVLPDGSSVRVAGNGLESGGGDGQSALSTGLLEVRGIDFDTTGGYYLATHRDSQVWYVDTAGTIHLLVDGHRSNGTHAGDGQPLTTPGQKISEPRAVALGPDRQMIITENDGGYIRVVNRATNVAGDYDYDGLLTAADMDLLTQVVRIGAHPAIFNLDPFESRFVDQEDRRVWIEDLVGSQFGDANLDGNVDDTDFMIWNDHKFTHNANWSTADFNGDGLTDVSDFNIWNANRTGSVGMIGSVPEPGFGAWMAGALWIAVRRRRQRRL